MSIPDFGAELAEYKNALLNAYYRGFDDAVESMVETAQKSVLKGQPQPQAPMPTPDAVPKRQFSSRGWTKAEDDVLRGAWARINFERLSQHFDRSAGACRLRGKVLGLCRIPLNHRYPEGEEL